MVFSQAIADEICEKVATSSKSLKALCKENPHWPNRPSIYRWMRDYKGFSEKFYEAKVFQINSLVDDILDIADDATNDDIDSNVFRARVRIDTRKWIAAKLAPRLYGNKVQIESNNLKEDPEIIRAQEEVKKLING